MEKDKTGTNPAPVPEPGQVNEIEVLTLIVETQRRLDARSTLLEGMLDKILDRGINCVSQYEIRAWRDARGKA